MEESDRIMHSRIKPQIKKCHQNRKNEIADTPFNYHESSAPFAKDVLQNMAVLPESDIGRRGDYPQHSDRRPSIPFTADQQKTSAHLEEPPPLYRERQRFTSSITRRNLWYRCGHSLSVSTTSLASRTQESIKIIGEDYPAFYFAVGVAHSGDNQQVWSRHLPMHRLSQSELVDSLDGLLTTIDQRSGGRFR